MCGWTSLSSVHVDPKRPHHFANLTQLGAQMFSNFSVNWLNSRNLVSFPNFFPYLSNFLLFSIVSALNFVLREFLVRGKSPLTQVFYLLFSIKKLTLRENHQNIFVFEFFPWSVNTYTLHLRCLVDLPKIESTFSSVMKVQFSEIQYKICD